MEQGMFLSDSESSVHVSQTMGGYVTEGDRDVDVVKAEVKDQEIEVDSAFFLETVVFLVSPILNIMQMPWLDLVLKVEGCLFKIPQRNLQEQSEVFRDMFSFPTAMGKEPEGSSVSNPIVLDGISKKDFRAFLQVLCPR